ncbi:hypothetical protein G3N96_08760 [Burkholderia sp. Se-20373]|uniref:hypothetical protein n=1 Tax=Burkholderia sp. Se-20373 TaxID=2703898 RepID=UPI001981A0CE|nr:hypothetical protein [Burkholderia sp. Se-20373]MBN3745524.1 hypothetical protein [Burkholderia sp. Se-20373]
MYGSLVNMLRGNVLVFRTMWALKINGTTPPSCPPSTKGLSPELNPSGKNRVRIELRSIANLIY